MRAEQIGIASSAASCLDQLELVAVPDEVIYCQPPDLRGDASEQPEHEVVEHRRPRLAVNWSSRHSMLLREISPSRRLRALVGQGEICVRTKNARACQRREACQRQSGSQETTPCRGEGRIGAT